MGAGVNRRLVRPAANLLVAPAARPHILELIPRGGRSVSGLRNTTVGHPRLGAGIEPGRLLWLDAGLRLHIASGRLVLRWVLSRCGPCENHGTKNERNE